MAHNSNLERSSRCLDWCPFLWKIHKDQQSGFPPKDERTAKISGKAATGAFWISYTFMVSLMLFTILGTEFLALPNLDAGWAIIAIMLVASTSNGLRRWYYDRKGDVSCE